MSLKGVKKAIYRTPHHLIGKKIQVYDDEAISTWEHDLTTSIAGLLYIQSETQKYHKSFKELLKLELDICDLMKDEEGDEEQENIRNIAHFQDIVTKLSDTIEYKFSQIDSNIGFRCKEVSTYLESLLKMLKKRNHKKTDVEIHSSNVQKHITKKTTYSDKDMVNLKKEQDLLDYSNKVFFEIDEKVKIIIPEALDMLSEFLNKLVLSFEISIRDVYSTVGKTFEKYARNQGMSSTKTRDVIKEWQQDFTSPKFSLDSMTLIGKYKDSPRRPVLSPSLRIPSGSKIRKDVSSIGEFALDTTTLLWKKTIHPRTTSINLLTLKLENPVQPKLSTGIFTSAVDPLAREESLSFASNYSSPTGNSRTPMTPQSPGFASSPWLKPLSLKKLQFQQGDDDEKGQLKDGERSPQETIPPSYNDTVYGVESNVQQQQQDDATVSNTSTQEGTEDHHIDHDKFFEEEIGEDAKTTTDATTITNPNAIEMLAGDIKRIRSTYSRHSYITQCPVTVNFGTKGNADFVNDELLRFQISANSTLSSKLLKVHLDL